MKKEDRSELVAKWIFTVIIFGILELMIYGASKLVNLPFIDMQATVFGVWVLASLHILIKKIAEEED